MSFPFITACSRVHRLDSQLSEMSVRGYCTGNQPMLNFSLRILQLRGTGQNWSDYSLVHNVAVAGASLQCISGRETVAETSLLIAFAEGKTSIQTLLHA